MTHPTFEALQGSPELIEKLIARARRRRSVVVSRLITRALRRFLPGSHRARPAPGASHRPGDAAGIAIRPAGGGDRAAIQALVRGLSPRSRYLRFFSGLRELPPQWLDRFTRPASEGELTLLALARRDGREVPVAMAQYNAGADRRGEFAVVVSDEWQGRGIGKRLMRELACIARAEGLARLEGAVLAENGRMLRMAGALGIAFERDPDDPAALRASLPLSDPRWRCAGAILQPAPSA
jgi:GNAT superfamily N-acetyltransferase